MIVGFKILCRGLKSPQLVKGNTFDECLRKFRDYWYTDCDVDTDEIISVEAIDINFDIQ